MNHFKGIVATVMTPIGVSVAWLPAIETALRIAVSAVGLVAAIYAARYWRMRGQKLRNEQEKDSAE
jgi:membrane protein implicated in regulation of membrane protease activity